MSKNKIIWIDLINPSHALFFGSLIPDLHDYEVSITLRDRAETVELARAFGINGQVIGTDYRDPVKKTLNMVYRTLSLNANVDHFDYALSFENGMNIFVAKLRRKKSILLCDNDLKFQQTTSGFQDLESKIKMMADYIIVPQACYENFVLHGNEDRIISYDGYKEDIYIANYTPDPLFINKIPFDQYVVVRPEALGSFYVNDKKSIVPDLLELFREEHINVIYLPRECEDYDFVKGFDDVYIPNNALNGLDLCYYAKAVLTGSGTMAREAACMGKTAVSFFPSAVMLSVDKQLMHQGRIFHSRNPTDIIDYILVSRKNNSGFDMTSSKIVKQMLINNIKRILEE